MILFSFSPLIHGFTFYIRNLENVSQALTDESRIWSNWALNED